MVTNWEDGNIQFPRLIAELEVAGAFTPEVIGKLCLSMDLRPSEIVKVIGAAQNEFEKISKEQMERVRREFKSPEEAFECMTFHFKDALEIYEGRGDTQSGNLHIAMRHIRHLTWDVGTGDC